MEFANKEKSVTLYRIAASLPLSLAICLGSASRAIEAPAPAFVAPLPNAEVLKILTEKLKFQPDESQQRTIRRVGNKTLEMEAFVSLGADAKYAPQILTNYGRYSQWALRGINQRPSGGTYLFQMHDAAVDANKPNRLVTSFSFDVPLFRQPRVQSLDFKSMVEPDGFTISLETRVDEENEISTAEAYMKVFPAPQKPGYSWIYIHGTIHIKPWLLYEAFPEKILNREAGDRLQIVLDNYVREETRLREEESKSRMVLKEKRPDEKVSAKPKRR